MKTIKTFKNFGGGITEHNAFRVPQLCEVGEHLVKPCTGFVINTETNIVTATSVPNSPDGNIKSVMRDYHDSVLYAIMNDKGLDNRKCFFITFTTKKHCDLEEFDEMVEETLSKIETECPGIRYCAVVEISNKNFKAGIDLFHAHAIIWYPDYLDGDAFSSAQIRNVIFNAWNYGYTDISCIKTRENLLMALLYITNYEGNSPQSALKLETLERFPYWYKFIKTSHDFCKPIEYVVEEFEPKGKLFTAQTYRYLDCFYTSKRYIV